MQYGHVPAAMDKVLEDTERRGVPPEQVAETIERALTARRMRARYLVGRDARAMLLASGCCPTTCSTASHGARSASERPSRLRRRRVDRQPREQAGRGGLRLQHPRQRVGGGQGLAAPGEQVQALRR